MGGRGLGRRLGNEGAKALATLGERFRGLESKHGAYQDLLDGPSLRANLIQIKFSDSKDAQLTEGCVNAADLPLNSQAGEVTPQCPVYWRGYEQGS